MKTNIVLTSLLLGSLASSASAALIFEDTFDGATFDPIWTTIAAGANAPVLTADLGDDGVGDGIMRIQSADWTNPVIAADTRTFLVDPTLNLDVTFKFKLKDGPTAGAKQANLQIKDSTSGDAIILTAANGSLDTPTTDSAKTGWSLDSVSDLGNGWYEYTILVDASVIVADAIPAPDGMAGFNFEIKTKGGAPERDLFFDDLRVYHGAIGIPEPSSFVLAGLGGLILAARNIKRRSAK
ncbi:PEP-CTERM sorting domain-containing protein [Poriferisphaera sp. WC338]|uniref:PEP-CTERM sorting domain-containing protein n=1 Tax=Poriferisphaera sp. WC338 TaxID=3425129 RepID=UPI003D812DF5